MEYIKADPKDTEQIAALVQETIRTIYPKYYPKEVVDFFCGLHSIENISKDIGNGMVGVLRKDHAVIGTGCRKNNHITRVYVKPAYQGQGCGSYIMQCLENEIGLWGKENDEPHRKRRIDGIMSDIPGGSIFTAGSGET